MQKEDWAAVDKTLHANMERDSRQGGHWPLD